jgi:hypothetical protein
VNLFPVLKIGVNMSDSETKNDTTVASSTAISSDSSTTVTTSNATPGRGTYLVSIIVLMVIIAIIIFLAWYLVQRNKTNTPSAIITNFGTTFISTKNGKILSINSIINTETGDLLQIMNARGFKDSLTGAIDVTCGWTLTPATGSATPTGIISSGYVTIQNNFTQEYCYYRPFPLASRPEADIQLISDVPPDANFPPPNPFPNPPPNVYRGWFKVAVTTIPGKVKASVNTATGQPNPTPDTTITVITFESVYKPGSFIIANTDGTVTLGGTTPNTDHIFQVVN